MKDHDEYRPVAGKTYSLFGSVNGTDGFYDKLSILTDEILAWFSCSEKQLLEYIQKASRYPRRLGKATASNPADDRLKYLTGKSHEVLSPYMSGIDSHLKFTSRFKHITDRELLTTREQYYLYMPEFELANRAYIEGFLASDFKIALLPYCLKENHNDCKAQTDEIDYRCRGCLKTCYINRVSSLLKEYSIHPYILSRGRVGGMLKELNAKHRSTGILGIACVVELVMGMRLCMKAKIPVVGIPSNANRCPRWMDTMYDTSVDLSAIERLLKFRV